MIFALVLLACSSPEADSDASGLVECRGMSHYNLLWRTVQSPFLSTDPETQYSVPRCQLLLSQQLTGEEVRLHFGNLLYLDTEADLGSGWVHADGKRWRIDAGTVTFDNYDDTLASGTYQFDASAVDTSYELTGDTATFEGPISWCEGLRADCPFNLANPLTSQATIDSPVMAEASGSLTGCRMLVDTQTGALDVQLQFGTWRGHNVAQHWVHECGAFGTFPPRNNLLRFRAGGVTGAGSYGPQQSWIRDGARLPDLSWEHPAVWYPGLNQTQACTTFYPYTATATTTDGSECSFDIDAEAQQFQLSCTQVDHRSGGNWPSTIGAFSLTADCEYIER